MILGKNIRVLDGQRTVFSTNNLESSDHLYAEKETQTLYLIQILAQSRSKDSNTKL